MYKCESWTVKRAERQRIDAFELWCWRRLLRVPWTARRSNQSILKEISPGCSLERMMLKLKLQYFGHFMWRVDSLEKTLMLGGIGGQEEKGTTEDEMAGWHHWLNGLESGWKSRTRLSDWTELKVCIYCILSNCKKKKKKKSQCIYSTYSWEPVSYYDFFLILPEVLGQHLPSTASRELEWPQVLAMVLALLRSEPLQRNHGCKSFVMISSGGMAVTMYSTELKTKCDIT